MQSQVENLEDQFKNWEKKTMGNKRGNPELVEEIKQGKTSKGIHNWMVIAFI